MLTYHQITAAERYALGLLRQRGLAAAAIARLLGRHRSTIGREVRRNGTPRDGCYRPQLAEWYACGRRSYSRRNRQFTPADWAQIQELLREDWSPEQAAGWLHRFQLLTISHETIYRYIWADKHAGGTIAAQPHPVQTITVDNGTEFHDYARLERATAARFYFATPHHAWERGTNENTNGLLRQYLPKRQSMAHLTQYDCNRIAAKLNRRPRKRLGYRTPEECYAR